MPSTFSSLVKALRQSFKKKQAKQMQKKFHRYEKQEPTKHAFLKKKGGPNKITWLPNYRNCRKLKFSTQTVFSSAPNLRSSVRSSCLWCRRPKWYLISVSSRWLTCRHHFFVHYTEAPKNMLVSFENKKKRLSFKNRIRARARVGLSCAGVSQGHPNES